MLRLIYFCLILGCGSIPLSKPELRRAVLNISSNNQPITYFIRASRDARMAPKGNLQIIQVAKEFEAGLCNLDAEPSLKDSINSAFSQKLLAVKSEIELMALVEIRKQVEPKARFHIITRVYYPSDNPIGLLYGLVYAATLGLIPLWVPHDASIEYALIENASITQNSADDLKFGTLTWSPIYLSGNTKYPADVRRETLFETCLKLFK